jgi:hypothetical protein
VLELATGFCASSDRGDRAAGPLVFDVPKGTRRASIVLREAPFSAGVRVTLP